MKFKIFLISVFTLSNIFIYKSFAQCSCCSAAFSGSALAAGTSNIGVLKEGSFRFIGLYRYLNGSRFYSGTDELKNLYGEELNVHFTGFNLGYGVTTKFTIDLEGGAFPDKDLNFGYTRDQISGMNSLALIGKYTIFADKETSQELTLGAGFRQPLTSNTTLSGNNGAILQLFYFKNITDDFNLIIFNRSEFYLTDKSNFKSGNNITSSVFLTKGIFEKMTGILETRYELQGISSQDNLDLINTGKQILSLVPQISYNFSDFSVSGFFELPVYRNFEGVQLAERFGAGLAIVYMF
jgi:hypothetical protein